MSACRVAALAVAILLALAPSRSGAAEEGSGAAELETALEWADAQPRSADSAYNAGLALAHADRLGEALFQLERAHLLAPIDREIQDARYVVERELRRRRIRDASTSSVTEGEPRAVSWWRFFAVFPPATYALLTLALTWLACGLFLWRRRLGRGALRDGLTIGAGASTLVLTLVAVMWGGQAWTARALEPAVVTATTPRFRDAPDELSRVRASDDLYEGAVVLIRERRGDWTQLELVDGARVWVTAGTASPLRRR